MQWVATIDELVADFELTVSAYERFAPVETDARIVFHDTTQDAARILTPAPRFMAALMAGGFVKRKRCVGMCKTGLPIFEGKDETMPAMPHDDAVAFVAWRDLPRGTNNFRIITTAELPQISGCIDKARAFRSAWRLSDSLGIHMPAARSVALDKVRNAARAALADIQSETALASLMGDDLAPLKRRAAKIRDAVASPRIGSAETPAALHAVLSDLAAAAPLSIPSFAAERR